MLFAFILSAAICCSSLEQVLSASSSGTVRGGEQQVARGSTVNAHRTLLQDAQPFIGGGQDAPEGRFPYACSLRTVGPRIHTCGGTLIAPEWVLTAAHCMTGEGSLGPTPVVYVGAHGINDDTYAEVILAEDTFVHESYTEDAQNGFDIALVRLKKPSTRQSAPLAHSEQRIGDGQFLAAVGWGKTTAFSPFPEVLQFADQMQYVVNKNCKRTWTNLKDSMLCAYSPSQAPCKGDSGGPLLLADSNGGFSVTDGKPELDVLVGIVSFGPSGCEATKPDVYTRVSSFRQWIDAKMGKSPPPVTQTLTDLLKLAAPRKPQDQLNLDLYKAAGAGQEDEVEKLLSKGADVEATPGDLKYTPLHAAAKGGHVAVTEKLIGAEADVDARNSKGETPLYLAAKRGFVDVAKALVKAGATVDMINVYEQTPLMSAASHNKVDMVEFLLRSGARIDAQDRFKLTPLFFAAKSGHVATAKALINAGADVNLAKILGTTPLFAAAEGGHLKMAELLLSSGAGANVNAMDFENATPLVAAAINDSAALVNLMLDNEGELNHQDKLGRTPAFHAAFHGSGEALGALKGAGADLDIRNKDGKKPVDVVCFCLIGTRTTKPCGKGKCGKSVKKRIKAILDA